VEVTVEDLSPIKKKLGIALPPEEVQAKIDAAYRGLSQRARIKGFRPGKAPRKVIESRIGPLAGREQAMQDSLPEYYSTAVIEHDVDVIAPPEIEVTGGQEGGPVAFDHRQAGCEESGPVRARPIASPDQAE
jgi:trigger factor